MSERQATLKIFISYAREDARDMALRFQADLRAVGYDAWLDLSEIGAGDSWSREIEQALESCDLMLALLSQGSYVSQICRAEQLRALRKGKRIIPALVQPDAEPPLHLEHLNYVNFSNLARYDEMFRDLLSDITAGQAFRLPEARRPQAASPFGTHPKAAARPYAAHEKRDARAFRRYITDLREEAWLGARYWWPYFLFYYADVHDVAGTLQGGELLSPSLRTRGKARRDRWDSTVRLYFRPRTPDLYMTEGLRPVERQRADGHCPIPVYLLFDLEAIVCAAESRFCDGDPAEANKTSKASGAFRDLPFDLIYHDSWFMADEREEVMRHRRAQVIAPDRLGLETLQYIWCRSQAEYETLRSLLPEDVWRQWRDKITTRSDYALFNRKWLYVDQATLEATQARLRFNRCEYPADCGPFTVRVEAESPGGKTLMWHNPEFTAGDDLLVNVSDLKNPASYNLRLYLNDDLAYCGSYEAGDAPF